MRLELLGEETAERRREWVDMIGRMHGDFAEDCEKIEDALRGEIKRDGMSALFDHIHTCGVIPESYEADTSEEKLYSKYTDILLSEVFNALLISSLVLKERADAADVTARTESYDFVADAKAFRISRTAKNQKDFKVAAMDKWKHGMRYAMVVSPLYQLPTSASQIYNQAAEHNVLVFSYSHLAILLIFSQFNGCDKAQALLHSIFQTVETMEPSKNALLYWKAINQTLLRADGRMPDFWAREKLANLDAIEIAKEEGLNYLDGRRKNIQAMSREDAVSTLAHVLKIDSKSETIASVSDNRLLDVV